MKGCFQNNQTFERMYNFTQAEYDLARRVMSPNLP